MTTPRIPRRAQARQATTRPEHFADGSGQLPHPLRVDSRDLQPGDNVRLAIGREGEPLEDRLMRGLGQSGSAHGTVLKVDKAGVHLTGHFEYIDHHGDANVVKKTKVAGMRFLHDDIGQVRRL